MAFADLTGQTFGRLTVTSMRVERGERNTIWASCLCECGKAKEIRAQALKKGATKSCGCLRAQVVGDLKRSDLLGQTFGRLRVVSLRPEGKGNRAVWSCLCECGSAVEVVTDALTGGGTVSCGCKRRDNAAEMGSARALDLTGQKVGSLLVLSRHGSKSGHSAWLCRCDCGNEVVVTSDLRKVRSCNQGLCSPWIDNVMGKVFNRLTVIAFGSSRGGRAYWICKCACGEETEVSGANLRSGAVRSCGCLMAEASAASGSANAEDLTGQKFGKLAVSGRAGSIRRDAAWFCTCECGRIVRRTAASLTDASSCGCSKSKPQTDLADFVRSLGVDIVEDTYQIREPARLQLDVYAPKFKIGIEYNGLYWHGEKDFSEKKYSAHLKFNEYAKIGVRVVTIFEDEWVFGRRKVESFLRSIFQAKQGLGIGARSCEVWKGDSSSFMDEHHLQGSSYGEHYALRHGGSIVACASFRRANRSKWMGAGEDVWELARYCTGGVPVAGGASRLLSAFLKDHAECDAVVSYSDNRWSTGGMYAKIGFVRENEGAPSYWYFKDGSCNRRIHRFNWRKDHALRVYGGQSSETEWEIMARNGWNRIWDCGKARWVYRVRE